MTVQELINKLNSLSDEQKQMKVGFCDYVYGWEEVCFTSQMSEHMHGEKQQVITLDRKL
jgi:hypothetical protein